MDKYSNQRNDVDGIGTSPLITQQAQKLNNNISANGRTKTVLHGLNGYAKPG